MIFQEGTDLTKSLDLEEQAREKMEKLADNGVFDGLNRYDREQRYH